MTPDTAQASAGAAAPHQVACLEIWGGTHRAEESLAMPGLDAWLRSEPFAQDTHGGDIHYVSSCAHGDIARFSLVDVAGHGEQTAVLAHRVRRLMRKHINKLDQTQFARVLNGEFNALAVAGAFATALLTTYFAPTGHLIVTNAGHPRPLWYRADRGSWEWLDLNCCADAGSMPVNLPLGIIAPTDYVQFAVHLQPRDLIVLYTDGLLDARDGDGQRLQADGLLALAESIAARDAQGFGSALFAAVRDFTGGAPLTDDATLVVIEHSGRPAPPQGILERARVLGRMLGIIGPRA